MLVVLVLIISFSLLNGYYPVVRKYQLYRARIGIFAGKKLTCNKRNASLVNATKSLILLPYLLVLSNITQILLIMSGVEINPGPSFIGKKNSIKVAPACLCGVIPL